jgi:hypothetical protein
VICTNLVSSGRAARHISGSKFPMAHVGTRRLGDVVVGSVVVGSGAVGESVVVVGATTLMGRPSLVDRSRKKAAWSPD